MPTAVIIVKCDTCFHTVPAQYFNRIADLERLKVLRPYLASIMSPQCFTWSLWLWISATFRGLQFSFCLVYPLTTFWTVYALITAWAALTSSLVGLTGCNTYFYFLSVLYIKGLATWQALKFTFLKNVFLSFSSHGLLFFIYRIYNFANYRYASALFPSCSTSHKIYF